MEEIWKDIKGFEGRYQVSNMGRVKSLARMVTHRNKAGGLTDMPIPERIICHNKTRRGYLIVSLSKDGKQYYRSLHRLVALHFCDGYKPGLVVNHKDENKLNNRADNLEWCTYKYNSNYGTGIKRSSTKLWKAIAQYDKNGNLIATYNSGREASEKTGFPRPSISDWCRGAHPCKAGYIWRFL
jgi:hypothetical protein